GRETLFGSSGQFHRVHALEIPCNGDQVPFMSNMFESANQELAELHHVLDDAEHWFDCLFAQGIVSAAASSLQAMRHGRKRIGIVDPRWRFGEALIYRLMVLFA